MPNSKLFTGQYRRSGTRSTCSSFTAQYANSTHAVYDEIKMSICHMACRYGKLAPHHVSQQKRSNSQHTIANPNSNALRRPKRKILCDFSLKMVTNYGSIKLLQDTNNNNTFSTRNRVARMLGSPITSLRMHLQQDATPSMQSI